MPIEPAGLWLRNEEYTFAHVGVEWSGVDCNALGRVLLLLLSPDFCRAQLNAATDD